MLKPKAVNLRISLWKFYNNISNNNEIPKSGLNFLVNKDNKLNAKFFFFVDLKNFKMFLCKSGYSRKIIF